MFLSLLLTVAGAIYFYRLASEYREVTFCIIVTSDLGARPALMPQAATVVAGAARLCDGPVVIADNGGLFLFDTAEALIRASRVSVIPEARYLAAAGYRFLNVTPDLFRLGTPVLKRLLHESGVSVVTANITGGGSKRMMLEGISLGLHGLVVSDEMRFMPSSLFEGMLFTDPFEGDSENVSPESADINMVLLNADLNALSTKQGADPSDVLSTINSRFPHPAIVVSNSAFPAKLLSEVGGSTLFVHLDHDKPALFFATVRMIQRRDGGRAVVSAIDHQILSFDKVVPDAALRDLFLSFREEIDRHSAESVGVPWFELDMNTVRKGDSPTHRFFHETLFAMAAESGVKSDASVALVPRGSFHHASGVPITVGDLRALFPDDRYPIVVSLTGSRLVELMQRGWERFPDAAVSLFPFGYAITQKGVVQMTDWRFSPDTRYVAVLDGRLSDLLMSTGEGEGQTLSVQVLPERMSTFVARRFPSKLSYHFSSLWRSE